MSAQAARRKSNLGRVCMCVMYLCVSLSTRMDMQSKFILLESCLRRSGLYVHAVSQVEDTEGTRFMHGSGHGDYFRIKAFKF